MALTPEQKARLLEKLAARNPNAKRVGGGLNAGQSAAMMRKMADRRAGLPSMAKGGTVKRTGPAYLHKGEKVVPKGNKARRR